VKRDEKLDRLLAEAEERSKASVEKASRRAKVRAFKDEYHDRMREETAARRAKKAS